MLGKSDFGHLGKWSIDGLEYYRHSAIGHKIQREIIKEWLKEAAESNICFGGLTSLGGESTFHEF